MRKKRRAPSVSSVLEDIACRLCVGGSEQASEEAQQQRQFHQYYSSLSGKDIKMNWVTGPILPRSNVRFASK